ncbi:MAG: hypothetical protein M0R17_05895 [Candidatus Omnitrophica bacterium]|jgi:hypothetical protein|nr:hypothetical protein [Candidatus Omnitrophota bacterium]
MNKQLKLTWKYFWEQKLKELGIFIFGVAGFVFIPYYFTILILFKVFPNLYINMFGEPIIMFWLMGLIFLFIISFLVAIIIKGIIEFIKWNWNKADERARKELGIKKKKWRIC